MSIYWSGDRNVVNPSWKAQQADRLAHARPWGPHGSAWSLILALACQVIVASLAVLGTLAYVYLSQ